MLLESAEIAFGLYLAALAYIIFFQKIVKLFSMDVPNKKRNWGRLFLTLPLDIIGEELIFRVIPLWAIPNWSLAVCISIAIDALAHLIPRRHTFRNTASIFLYIFLHASLAGVFIYVYMISGFWGIFLVHLLYDYFMFGTAALSEALS